MTTFLPYVVEPEQLRLDLNTPDSLVKYPNIRTTPREATIRQGGAFLKRVWPAWKEILKPAGVRYQDLMSASAANDSGWRDWADGNIPWLSALEGLVVCLNARTGAGFGLTS